MNSTRSTLNPTTVCYAAMIAVSLFALPALALSNACEPSSAPTSSAPSSAPSSGSSGNDPRQNATVEADAVPSAAEVHEMMKAIIANQHQNDAALAEFERTEHVITRKGDEGSPVLSDHSNRLIPSGTGVTRFEVQRGGVPISREMYREHLQIAVDALSLALQPNEREKLDASKYDKRKKERSDAVETTLEAFQATWAGRETRGSQTYAKFLLEPDPAFKPTTRLAEIFRHVKATLWVDESQKQIARIEGDITSDVSFGGGIVGKLYRGGHFVIEQSEVAPGVWEPTLVSYDVRGREVFVGVSFHERTETSHYRRLGPPQDAIDILREELNTFTDASIGQ